MLNEASLDTNDLQFFSPSQEIPTLGVAFNLLRSAQQGVLHPNDLPNNANSHESICDMLSKCKSGSFAQRNKAMLALSLVCRLPISHLAQYPVASTASLYRWKQIFERSGFKALIEPVLRERLRCHDQDVGIVRNFITRATESRCG
jgi:hypothetical protein